MMLYSVVDIAGLNRISRVVLNNAAAAMIGMVQANVKNLTPQPPSLLGKGVGGLGGAPR